MSFELAASLRRLRPQRPGASLNRRLDSHLTFVDQQSASGAELLLDTSVYIDVLQGRVPPAVEQLLTLRTLNHSAVALSELTHLFGRLDPSHAATKSALGQLTGLINDIPERRLLTPSLRTHGEAGMLAGLVARLTDRPHGSPLLNDAMLCLQAAETGRVLLTGNIPDFDLLQQLVPSSAVLFYRRV